MILDFRSKTMSNDTSESIPVCQTVIYPPNEGEKPKPLKGTGRIYRASGNLVIIKNCAKTVPKQFVGTVRNAISGFTPSTGTRMRRYLRECMAEYREMVTLTYPGFFTTNGKETKEHLRRFLQEVKREYRRNHGDDGMFSAFWFLEFQTRGAPHYHIFLTWAPSKQWVSSTWYRIVNSEDVRHLHAGTRTEYLHSGRGGTISYASKYAAKQEQKDVPENFENVGRFWGVHGRRSVMSASTFVETSEMSDPKTQMRVNDMFKLINLIIREGLGEVMIRESGVCVLNVWDKQAMKKVRVVIARLMICTQKFDSMFYDAEIEWGEGRPCP